MPERKDIKKFTFTVEGETEKWYLEWLRDQINACEKATCKASIVAKVQQNPSKFIKSQTRFTTPSVTHICDMESNDPDHQGKFTDIIDRIAQANKSGKKIKYGLAYSNFTFELWMVLHKMDCFGALSDRSLYLDKIRRAFGEQFESLKEYKEEGNFKHCLSKLTLVDVKTAVTRARKMMDHNKISGKHLTEYKGFQYYKDNPALTIWESVDRILDECGVKQIFL